MSVSPIAICSGIGASILVLLVAACGGDPTVAPAPIAVTQVEVQPSATTAATAPPEVPTATTIPTPTAEPTATPLPTPHAGADGYGHSQALGRNRAPHANPASAAYADSRFGPAEPESASPHICGCGHDRRIARP